MPSNKTIPDFSRITNQSELSSAFGIDANTTFSSARTKPWDGLSTDVFFQPLNIDPTRWNRLYPYRFLVVDVETNPENPKIVPAGSVTGDNKTMANSQRKEVNSSGGIEYVLDQQILSGNWAVTLPITPQQFQITDQFAINTTATMRGIVEEHNGVKFKMINMSGSTGIWPQKPTKSGEIKPISSLGSIFGGTLEALGGVAEAGRSLSRAFSGEHPNRPPKALEPQLTSNEIFSTGYYQAHYLAQFLEQYAMLKKNPKNKGWRLVLDIPKQNQAFVVTPVLFTLKQDQQRPNEITYNIQLKAWKRIEIKEGSASAATLSPLESLAINDFQRIVNTLRETRRVLGSASNLIKAVRSDSQRVFDILRQTSLIIKDIGGVIASTIDLPNQIIKDFQSTIESSVNNLRGSFALSQNDRLRDPAGSGGFKQVFTPMTLFENGLDRAGQIAAAIRSKQKNNEGLSSDQVASGSLGSPAAQSLDTDPLNNVFNNPQENFDFFDSVNIDELELAPEQEDAIEKELEKVRLLTIDDLRDFKNEMLKLALEISNNYGAGDETYSAVYGASTPKSRTIPMSIEENEVVDSIFETIQIYDELTATKFFDDLNIESPLEYVGELADETEIDFEQSTSKIPVPVPFGLTIEEVAARYMGDADKWLEIVTLNNLRSPYIDETGFSLNFLSNGDERQFTIFDEENRLFVGQRILLQSDTVPLFTRKIIELEEVSENNFLVTVDGLADLDNLTVGDNARMQCFLPGTVNSQNRIYIPFDGPADPDDRTFDIPGVSDDYLAKISKVDFLLTDDGDVAVNSVGDFRLSSGLTNMIQALKLKIRTKKGTVLKHLDYGLGLEAGVSVADIERGIIIGSLNKMIEDDPRYDSIDQISLRIKGSTLGIDMSVKIANGTGVLPISLDVPLR
jgi:hypothetical protein